MALGLTSGVALAQFRGCPVDHSRCLDDVLSSQCAERGTSAETCQALVTELQIQQRATATTAIGETLGSALYHLADLALFEGDRSTEAAYRAIARQVFLDVVSNDESAHGAYTMLAVIDHESIADSIAWARQAVAAGQSWIVLRGLVSRLFQVGTPQAISEATDVAERAYSDAEPGREKWRSAAYAYRTYQLAGLQFPGSVAPGAADEFVDRVRQDSNWDIVSRLLDDPARQPAAMRNALETACHLAGVFGAEPCLRGIEVTVQAVTSHPDSPDAQILADAAAFAMMAAPRGGDIVTPDTRTPTLVAWLNQFLSSGLDSLAVLEAIATVSLDRDRRRGVRREIVARNPNSGQARFELGKVYYDQRYWAEALVQLEMARELSPPEDQMRIRSYLRQAKYEVGNVASVSN
jgi:hypothetical protein